MLTKISLLTGQPVLKLHQIERQSMSTHFHLGQRPGGTWIDFSETLHLGRHDKKFQDDSELCIIL